MGSLHEIAERNATAEGTRSVTWDLKHKTINFVNNIVAAFVIITKQATHMFIGLNIKKNPFPLD